MGQVTLPAWYVAEHVDYAYALTANKAQGMTVDHVLFAPSPATSRETAYTALSRGRYSNHIYAVDESGWQEAIATSRAHTFANDQHPTRDDTHRLAVGQGNPRERGDVRARLLATHTSEAATSGQDDPDRERQRSRKQHQQTDHRGDESHRPERGRDDELYIGM